MYHFISHIIKHPNNIIQCLYFNKCSNSVSDIMRHNTRKFRSQSTEWLKAIYSPNFLFTQQIFIKGQNTHTHTTPHSFAGVNDYQITFSILICWAWRTKNNEYLALNKSQLSLISFQIRLYIILTALIVPLQERKLQWKCLLLFY